MADNAQQTTKAPARRQERDSKPNVMGGEKQFQEQVISIDRIARVVKGGRRFRFKALVVVGDGKTKVGIGVSKGQDVQAAVTKATEVAKKSMIIVPLNKATIPHEVELKFGGARVMMKPAAPGTGIIAGGAVRTIIGVTGIRDLLTKSLGSSNKVNVAYATIAALETLVPADKWLNPPKASKAEAKPVGKKS